MEEFFPKHDATLGLTAVGRRRLARPSNQGMGLLTYGGSSYYQGKRASHALNRKP